jgi:hypothetical protein
MTYFQDMGADAARVASDLIPKLVTLSLAAAIGGIIPTVGTPAQAAARTELAATVKSIPPEDRSATVTAAVTAGGNAAELQKALDAANDAMSTTTKIAIVGGVAVGAYLLFGRKRR